MPVVMALAAVPIATAYPANRRHGGASCGLRRSFAPSPGFVLFASGGPSPSTPFGPCAPVGLLLPVVAGIGCATEQCMCRV